MSPGSLSGEYERSNLVQTLYPHFQILDTAAATVLYHPHGDGA